MSRGGEALFRPSSESDRSVALTLEPPVAGLHDGGDGAFITLDPELGQLEEWAQRNQRVVAGTVGGNRPLSHAAQLQLYEDRLDPLVLRVAGDTAATSARAAATSLIESVPDGIADRCCLERLLDRDVTALRHDRESQQVLPDAEDQRCRSRSGGRCRSRR
jgi:hypothetical protein